MINAEQLMGILRSFIPGFVAISSYYGIGTDATNTVIATAIATAIVSAWSAYSNKPGTVIPPKSPDVTIVKSSPGIQEITTVDGTTKIPT